MVRYYLYGIFNGKLNIFAFDVLRWCKGIGFKVVAKRSYSFAFSIKKRVKMKEKIKIAIGLILLPFAFVLFFIDRIILSALPHLDSVNMKKWFNNTSMMTFSLIRVFVITLIFVLYKLISLYLQFRSENG